MVYLRKEIFPIKTYNKIKMKEIGPCKIVRKISTNAYEIKFPEGIGISTIFNVAELYPYKDTKLELQKEATEYEVQTLNLVEQMPKIVKKEVKAILEKRVSKRTRGHVYFLASSKIKRIASGGF